ncbi:hypothetical protein CDIK_2117 [Cucumispora dikerogammari]|nr:hypothetical protein CDIK_2117 [Cucumispora dikerogammari]
MNKLQKGVGPAAVAEMSFMLCKYLLVVSLKTLFSLCFDNNPANFEVLSREIFLISRSINTISAGPRDIFLSEPDFRSIVLVFFHLATTLLSLLSMELSEL